MEKKSKLAIKHYHGKELEKIGKPNAFPLYTMVRYKNAKTRFPSRLGLRYVKKNGGDVDVLGRYNKEVIRIIEEEEKYIQMMRNYFEDCLDVEFKPSMVVNEWYERTCLENVVDYFDVLIDYNSFKDLLIDISWDLFELLEVAGPIRFLSGLKFLNLKLFNEIVQIEEVKEVFEYYEVYKSLQWPEVNRIQFRMVDFENEKIEILRLKKWLDEKFDYEMLRLYNMNPLILNFK